jgi:hypothetical protein
MGIIMIMFGLMTVTRLWHVYNNVIIDTRFPSKY